MAKTFDIGAYAAGLQARGAAPAVPAERDIEAVTAEILRLKQDAGNAILGIGQRLIEAKEMLPHGAWLPWLEERVEFSERTARNFMRLTREWTNRQALADLGAAKALTLLALPPEERETFMSESHLVDGEEKSVIDMTSRELEKAIRERDEARQAAESAHAEARTAEESRTKMESDMQALERIHKAAQEGEASARAELARLQEELQALREKPVEVAVETVVDEAAIAKAREEAVAGMQKQVEQAEAARQAAEKKCRSAEKALEEAKKQASANADLLSHAEAAEAELSGIRKKLEAAEAESRSALHSDVDLAAFNVLFSQAQNLVNQMQELLAAVRGRDAKTAEQLQAALLALAELVRRCAE